MRNWLLALVSVAVWFLAAHVQSGTAPRGADAPANQFSAARAEAVLARIEGPQRPHPAGSAENIAVHARVRRELAALGVPVTELRARQCYGEPRWSAIECADIIDLVAEAIPGNGKAILLMAHLDSVPAGPGAGDDGSGVATLLETIRALKAGAITSRHPVIALFTDGEEAGLLGATAFVRDARWRDRVGVVINDDQRGSAGQSLLFQISPGDARLIDLYADSAPRLATSSLYGEIFKILPNDTDLTPFLNAGLTGYNFAFVGEVAHYHTARDTIANLDPRSLQSSGDAVLGLTRALLDRDFASLKSGNAIYLDVMGIWLPRLGAAWALPLSLLAFAVIALAAWRRRPTVGGLLMPPAFLIGAVAGGFALKGIAALISGHADPSYAQPLMLRLALASGVWSLALLAARRATATASWLWFAGFAVVAAWALPGLSPYFLFPSLVAAAALPFGISWVPALASLLIWIQLTAAAEPLMGLAVTPLFTLPAAMGLMTVLPLLRFDRPQAIACGVLALLLTVAAGFVPAYDTAHPQRLNFRYVQADGHASWVADPVRPLPDAVRAAAAFSQKPQVIADDTTWHGYVAAAGTPRFASPTATVTREGADVIVKLQGSQAADGMTLTVPAAAGLTRVAVDGQKFPVSGPARRLLISCASPGCRDSTVTLTTKRSAPFTVQLSEQRYGLPPGGLALQKARGTLATPSQFGDGVELVTKLRIN
ncbi:MAG: M20/M25/M40 family metallo-hydrolase [Pseudomonadota bacterium]